MVGVGPGPGGRDPTVVTGRLVAAQGPDKVLPAESVRFPGLARAEARCQGLAGEHPPRARHGPLALRQQPQRL